MADIIQPASLLGLPAEIRLQIYSYLFNDYDNSVFQIRNEDPKEYASRGQHHLRTKYRILGGVLYRQSQPTTYTLATPAELHTNILGVNRKISEEGTKALYGKHTLDFGEDIEAIVPFLSDLRPSTLELIHEIALTKKGSIFSRDFDRCEWHNACVFISQNLRLRKVSLSVVGGRPMSGWDDMVQYTVQDFKTLASVGFDGLEWVGEFLQIRRLQELEIISRIEHCPPPRSTAMAFFASFSASIDKGFREYIRAEMLSGS